MQPLDAAPGPRPWRLRPVGRAGAARRTIVALLATLLLPVAGLAPAVACAAATARVAAVANVPTSQRAAELPLPPGAGSPPSFRLSSWHVACPSSSWCLLTGTEETQSQLYLAVVDTWSSGAWSSQLLPVPGGGVSFGASPQAVTCTAPGQCTVVGFYGDQSGSYALVDTLAGRTWTPTELSPPPTADPFPELVSVSCAGVGSCVAVGDDQVSGYGVDEPLVAVSSGGSWTIAAGPETSGMTTASLTSVSCPSTTSCVAVGSEENANQNTYGLIDTYSSTGGWSARTAAVSGGITTPGKYYGVSSLDSVDCPLSGTCFAAGWFAVPGGAQYPLVDEQLGAGSWSGVDAGTVGGSVESNLASIACLALQSGRAVCTAGGTWNSPSDGAYNPLLETYNASSWTLAAAPEPADVGPVSTGEQSDTLRAVACSTGTCAAVGSYETTSGVTLPLIDTVVPGSSAGALAAPEPAGAGATSSSALQTVACAAGTCVTAGNYSAAANGAVEGMADVGSGTSYGASELPAPSTPPPDPAAGARAVACTGSSSCVAIGSYSDASGAGHAMVETELDGSWQEQDAPLLAGTAGTVQLAALACPAAGACVVAGEERETAPAVATVPVVEVEGGTGWSALGTAPPAGSSYVLLSDLSCPGVGSCVAVGRSLSATTHAFVPLVVSLAGGVLSDTTPPYPAGAGTVGLGVARFETGLAAVSCASTTSCVAVGMYPDSSGRPWGLIESGSGTSWSALQAPQPADAAGESAQSAALRSVSCPSAGTCYAGGYYTDNAPGYAPLVDSLSGGTWSATRAPTPSNAGVDSYLTTAIDAISCAGAGECSAVGVYPDSSGNYWGLLDTLSGGTWSALPPTDPPGGGTGSDQDVTYTSVRCPSAGWCVASGVYRNSAGTQLAFLATGSGGSWALAPVAVPANSTSQQLGIMESPGAIGCTASGDCVVPGDYYDSGPVMQAFADTVVPPAPAISSVSPPDGPAAGGSTLTVEGSGFFPGMTATVGGQPAGVSYVSPGVVEVTTPPGQGPTSLGLVTDGGSASVAWTYDGKPQQVSFASSPSDATYGGSYTPLASATSGLPVSYSVDPSSGAGVCSLSRGSVEFTGTGTCVLDASQPGDADWAPATTAQQIDVRAASQSVTLGTAPTDATVGGSWSPSASATSGLAPALSLDPASDPGACSLAGGTLSFSGVGSCVLDATQPGSTAYSAAAPASEAIDVARTSVGLAGVPTGVADTGSRLHVVATISPVPEGGTVSFSLSAADGAVAPGCAAVPVSAGSAACDLTPAAAGQLTVTAAFSGAGATGPASASAPLEVVDPAAVIPASVPPGLSPGSQIAVVVGVSGGGHPGESVVVTGPGGSSLGPTCPPSGVRVEGGAATCTFPASRLGGDASPGGETLSIVVICPTCSGSPQAGVVLSVIPPGGTARRLAAEVSSGAGRGAGPAFGAVVRLRLLLPARGRGRVRFFVDGVPACSARLAGSCATRLRSTGRQVVLGEYEGPLAVVVRPVRLDVVPAVARWRAVAHRNGGRLSLSVVGEPATPLPVTSRPRGIVAVRGPDGRLLGTARLRPLRGGGATATWSGDVAGPVRIEVHTGRDYAPAPTLIAG